MSENPQKKPQKPETEIVPMPEGKQISPQEGIVKAETDALQIVLSKMAEENPEALAQIIQIWLNEDE